MESQMGNIEHETTTEASGAKRQTARAGAEMHISTGRSNDRADNEAGQDPARHGDRDSTGAEARRAHDHGIKYGHRRRDVSGSVRADKGPEETAGEYICCICGATLKETKHWGPICKRTGKRACAECCRRCSDHISWSGIWRCGYITQSERMERARRRAADRFEAENRKASDAHKTRRREFLRKRAIKEAGMRKKYQRKLAEKQG